tara:strand:- start:1416 stop:2333 length:918 start_codon:yes stop_codon:yes gene_type:complete
MDKKIKNMETNNFEQQSRERFEELHIQPSDSAWGKLEQMLNEAQPEKKKASFPWFAIAASFIGILIIASMYFVQNGSEENKFVEQNSDATILKTESPIVKAIDNKQEIVATDFLETEILETKSTIVGTSKRVQEKNKREAAVATLSKNNTSIIKDQIIVDKDKNTLALSNKKEEAYIAINSPKKILTEITKEQKPQMDAIYKVHTIDKNAIKTTEFDNQINSEIAQVKELKKTKSEVTDADIDVLLLKAQQQLQINRILKHTNVDAMALLGDAEMELNDSFRNKIFYALEEGLAYVKTAIVSRND